MTFPERACDLLEPCTKGFLGRMLRNRGYKLEVTQYKKDKGLTRVYMYDPWADPALVQIGSYEKGERPDWAAMYDEAMYLHLERKRDGTRYGE